MKKIKRMYQTIVRQCKRPSTTIKGLMLCCAAYSFVLLTCFEVQAIDFIISGGKNKADQVCVDDMIYIYVNGERVFTDYTWAGCKGPFTIEAEEGDLIEIDAIDNIGSCRGISPVYIHRADCDSYGIITEGRQDGCQGWPASMEPFFVATYIVDLQWLSCPDVKVTTMQCARAGGPTIKILGPDNQPITPDSSEYPPEAIAPNAIDPEKVVFALDETQPDPENDITYEATGWIKLGTEEGYHKLYDNKDITFGPGKHEITVTYNRGDILPPDKVLKTGEVYWTFTSDEGEVSSYSAAKELYFVVRKSPLNVMKHRKEILDIACEIARGLKQDNEIRATLESGLYNRYKNPNRYYSTPGHFNTILLASGTFDLTGFLQSNSADCADMATMHMLSCNALGIPQEMIRVWTLVVFSGGLTPKSGSMCLGTYWQPGELTFVGGWHQISYDDLGMKVYDPLMMFDKNGSGTFEHAAGMNLLDYKKLFKQQWINITRIYLLGVK